LRYAGKRARSMWSRCPRFAQAVTASALGHATIASEGVVLNWVTDLATGKCLAICAARDDPHFTIPSIQAVTLRHPTM